jgi:uncharacterized protein
VVAPVELSAPALRDVMVAYRDVLRSHQELINRLNVYPVPDGDTGTNMSLTIDSVVGELEALDPDPPMADVCKAISHGSLMGARGNSGVILSQLLRGVAEQAVAHPHLGPAQVAGALVEAAVLAYQAVVRPVEGTMLTVARAGGEGAQRACAAGSSLCQVLESARDAAQEALDATPELLPVLARAGVVDAGGAGYVLLFDAFLSVLDGRPLPASSVSASVPAATDTRGEQALALSDVPSLRYEVMYLLEAPDDTIADFKEVWAGLGDSIVVVGGDGLWNCHIHTDDIGAAVEAALDCGRPRQIRVSDLAEQVEEERWVREHAGEHVDDEAAPAPVTGVVAVVTGEGIGRIFRSLGVHHLVAGGQSMNPSTAEIAEVVAQVGSEQVVVLPNNKNIRPVAERVNEVTPKSVTVVPTNSIVEGFAALLAYDPSADAPTNVAAMTESAARVVAGEVTQAVRDAQTDAGSVRAGEWIGMSRDGVLSVSDSVSGAACGLLEVLMGAAELLTVIEGEGSSAPDTRRITEWVHDRFPDASVEVHHGGQPLYAYLFGVE